MFFFFSSRRRHTRYWRDWSSDVCSSDLNAVAKAWLTTVTDAASLTTAQASLATTITAAAEAGRNASGSTFTLTTGLDTRSEERRVGKECRSRWSPYH